MRGREFIVHGDKVFVEVTWISTPHDAVQTYFIVDYNFFIENKNDLLEKTAIISSHSGNVYVGISGERSGVFSKLAKKIIGAEHVYHVNGNPFDLRRKNLVSVQNATELQVIKKKSLKQALIMLDKLPNKNCVIEQKDIANEVRRLSKTVDRIIHELGIEV